MKRRTNFLTFIAVGLLLLITLYSPNPLRTSAQHLEKTTPGLSPGLTIVEGDIQMPIDLVNEMRSIQKAPGAPRASFKTNLWPNGIVPFEFEATCAPTSTCTNAPESGCVSQARQMIMLNAMAVLEQVSNVDFQQCPNNQCTGNHILIRDSSNDTRAGANNVCENTPANNSFVGMRGNGEQRLNIVNWDWQFVIVHELLHSLGLLHEQSRADRDSYVQINCENLQGGCGPTTDADFGIASQANAFGYYDFDSVMQYDRCAFSIDCPAGASCNCTRNTITVLSPYDKEWQNKIGQRNHLSAMDRTIVSFLYPRPDWCFVNCDYQGGNGPADGSFWRPFASFAAAMANTPEGGTVWILNQFPCQALGIFTKPITVRTVPGITATLGQ